MDPKAQCKRDQTVLGLLLHTGFDHDWLKMAVTFVIQSISLSFAQPAANFELLSSVTVTQFPFFLIATLTYVLSMKIVAL